MTKAGRKVTAALVAALTMIAAERASAHDEPLAALDQHEGTVGQQWSGGEPTPGKMFRVRSHHPELRAVIMRAREQSVTFHRMVETIDASDGIVYLEPGMCRHGVRACLMNVTSAGRYRSLFVKVDIARAERKLMSAIGHELRHAIEVLSDPTVTDYATMRFFYMNKSERIGTANAFETTAAIKAGEAVADEIRQFRVSVHDEPTAATDPREATIVLHVVNYAALSRDVLNKAKDRVATVYEGIGVRIVWVDSELPVRKHQDSGLHLTVMLLSRDMAQQKISVEGIKDDVLGQALGGRAYIFCDRIATASVGFFSIRLGIVIAHEVGHLVLPANSHSLSGIMRATTDVQHTIDLQSFDKTQARIIRTTLMEPTAGATAR